MPQPAQDFHHIANEILASRSKQLPQNVGLNVVVL